VGRGLGERRGMADLLASDESDEDVEPAAKSRKLDPPAQPAPAAQAAPAKDVGAAAAKAATQGGGGELRNGMAVELVGFASSAMNGAKGKLGKFSEAKGIWQVFLEGTETAKAVKPKNLKPSAAPEPAAKKAADPAPAPAGGKQPAARGKDALKMGEFSAMPKPKFVNFKTDWRPDDNMPQDNDANGWLEVLRDVYVRQLREINQYPEPPPFHTIFEPVADPTAADTKALRQALTMQLQILTRARYGEGSQPNSSSWGGKGHKGGGHMAHTSHAGLGKPSYPWQQSKGSWGNKGSAPFGKGPSGPPRMPMVGMAGTPAPMRGPDPLQEAAQILSAATKA